MQINMTWALDAVDGDWDLLKEVVSDVVDEVPEQLISLRASLEQHDPDALERGAHYLKGSLGTIGAESASAVAFELEKHGRAHEFVDTGRLMNELEHEINQLKAFFATPDWDQHV